MCPEKSTCWTFGPVWHCESWLDLVEVGPNASLFLGHLNQCPQKILMWLSGVYWILLRKKVVRVKLTFAASRFFFDDVVFSSRQVSSHWAFPGAWTLLFGLPAFNTLSWINLSFLSSKLPPIYNLGKEKVADQLFWEVLVFTSLTEKWKGFIRDSLQISIRQRKQTMFQAEPFMGECQTSDVGNTVTTSQIWAWFSEMT